MLRLRQFSRVQVLNLKCVLALWGPWSRHRGASRSVCGECVWCVVCLRQLTYSKLTRWHWLEFPWHCLYDGGRPLKEIEFNITLVMLMPTRDALTKLSAFSSDWDKYDKEQALSSTSTCATFPVARPTPLTLIHCYCTPSSFALYLLPPHLSTYGNRV